MHNLSLSLSCNGFRITQYSCVYELIQLEFHKIYTGLRIT